MIPIDFSIPIQSKPAQEKFWKAALTGLAVLAIIALYAGIGVMVTQP